RGRRAARPRRVRRRRLAAIRRRPGDAGAAPSGWSFYQIAGAQCRDGSPTGFYVHYGTAQKLFIYLEGGGACSSASFCSHNPSTMNQSFPGGAQSQGQTIGGSIAAFSTTPQQPYLPTPASGLNPAYSPGIFDFTNAANPVKDWSGVYVPYCTGDVHFGTADNVTIPAQGLLAALPNQHFVGHLNLQKFIARIVPTFPSVTQVLLTGASAGGFGAGLNYGMVQDSFGAIPVTVLDDSGPPLRIDYLPACVQQQWRQLWGFDAALTSDCAECFRTDGSGLTDIVLYWHHKYANAKVGLVSTTQDEVMRLFFASGDNNCQTNDATVLDGLQVGGGYTGAMYTAGLQDLVSTYACTGALATYYIGGSNSSFPNPTFHQHIFRSEFYTADTNAGGITLAQWTANLLSGNLQIVGP
ncbi:MAG: pectin acetylesterase-family hydrolase, partial [Polyangiaceae bacterium]